jgi:hypothetical protein
VNRAEVIITKKGLATVEQTVYSLFCNQPAWTGRRRNGIAPAEPESGGAGMNG